MQATVIASGPLCMTA